MKILIYHTLFILLVQLCTGSSIDASQTAKGIFKEEVQPTPEVKNGTTPAPTTSQPPITTTATPTTNGTTVTPPTSVTPPTTSTTTTTTTPSTTVPTSTVKPTSPTPITTLAPTTTKPTAAPTSKPEPDRKFDGPSFIGGMILTMGLMAIAFVSWKFYKARTERNYHTL